jgi:hypothetical protein
MPWDKAVRQSIYVVAHILFRFIKQALHEADPEGQR